MNERARSGSRPGAAVGTAAAPPGVPGKTTLVQQLQPPGGGQPLPDALRTRFEQSLAADLGAVRIHTDASAAAAADSVGARAFAHGQDIYFAAGEYEPDSPAGAELIAHEVAHTVQQRGEPDAPPQLRARASEPGDASELAADRAAAAMVTGAAAPAVGTASLGIHRTPRYATVPDSRFATGGTTAEMAGGGAFLPASTHWVTERLITETIEIPGAPSTTGTFVVSRHQLGEHQPAPWRGGAMENASTYRDYGPLPRFIENHPQLARLWGLRVLRNADGSITHVVTPTPATFVAIRQALAGDSVADMTPTMGVMEANQALSGEEFAQAIRVGTPPISTVDPSIYYHDWMQHLVGILSIGPRTAAFFRQIADLVRDLFVVADRASHTPQTSDPVDSARSAYGPTGRLRPGRPPRGASSATLQAVADITGISTLFAVGEQLGDRVAELVNDTADRAPRTSVRGTGAAPSAQPHDRELNTVLRSAIAPVATSGFEFERATVALSRLMSAPPDQIDEAAVRAQLTDLWNTGALTTAFATGRRSELATDAQRTAFDAALVELAAVRARHLPGLQATLARRDAAVAADVAEVLGRSRRAESLPQLSVRLLGQDLPMLDERRVGHRIEELAVANQLPGALAELDQQAAALRGSVERANQRSATTAQAGSDASGVAAATPDESNDARRLELIEQVRDRVHGAIAGREAARTAFLDRFQQVGLALVGNLLARASSTLSSRAAPARHAEHAARTLTPQQEAALIDRARSVVGPDFIWTNAEVFQAVERAMNLGEHPLRRQWVEAERARRTPPPESHTLRNVLIGAAIIVGVVVTAGVLAEVGAGAAAVTGGATEVATGSVLVETAGGVTNIRAVYDVAAVVDGLTPLAESQLGARALQAVAGAL